MSSARYCAACLNTFADDPAHCPNLSCGSARPDGGWGALHGPGDLLDRNYYIDRVLAVGGAGLTYLAREIDADGVPQPPELAIKVLYTQRDAGPFLRRLANEAQILQDLNHPNIVECRGFVHRTGRAPYLVTLFEHGGSLTGHVKRHGTLPGWVACGVVKQILLALDMAHQRGIVHRDLKPENVLLRASVERWEVPRVRVADFGIAKVQGGVGQSLTRVGSFVGTPEYAAPEQFEGKAPTPATDVFAAGGLLYNLLTGEAPIRFEHRMDLEHSYAQLLDQMPPRLPALDEDPAVVEGLQAALAGMMQVEATDRWTIRQVIARLDEVAGRAESAAHAEDASSAPSEIEDFDFDLGSQLQAGSSTFVMGLGPGDVKPSKKKIGQEEPKPGSTAHGTLLLTEQGPRRAALDDWNEPVAAGPVPPPPEPERLVPPPPPPVAPEAPRRPEAPSGTRPSAPWDAPPPEATRPRVPEAPSRPPEPAFQPPAPSPKPRRGGNDLSLDDLFGAPVPVDDLDELVPSKPKRSGFFEEAPPAPAIDAFFDTPSAPARPAAPPKPPAPPPPVAAAGRWSPDEPAALPSPLPSDPRGLLRALGVVHPADRAPVLAALRDLDGGALADALRSHRGGEDPRIGRGVGLAIAALERVDLANTARGLLSDPDAGVRCCAAEAMGVVGSGGLLAQLNRLLADAEPRVRACAARALALACARTGQPTLGRSWLSQLASDRSDEVRDAYRNALAMLD